MIRNTNDKTDYFIGESVELGIDPLSSGTASASGHNGPVERGDSLLRDLSFCKVEHPSPESLSPARGRRNRGVSPCFDNEHQLTSHSEPYILMDNPDEEVPSRDMFPGKMLEEQLNSLNPSESCLYPELPGFSSNRTSNIIVSTGVRQSAVPLAKTRSNPFSQFKEMQSRPANEVELTQPGSSTYPGGRPQATPSNTGHSNGPYTNHAVRTQHTANPTRPKDETNEVDEIMTALKIRLNNAVHYFGSLAGNNFDASHSICFLGRFYYGRHQQPEHHTVTEHSVGEKIGSFKDFLVDFKSRIWVTYRKGFPPLKGRATVYTSDTGWGCMLRTGQMMLATVLQVHAFGRDWRKYPRTEPNFKDLIRFFGDSPEYPFSLHNLLKVGNDHLSKEYGEWYGPSTVAYVLRVCVDYTKQKLPRYPSIDILKNFVIYTATDCMIFQQDIINSAEKPSNNLQYPGSWTRTLLLVSVRMGADELNITYKASIQHFLSSHLCIGIMGGRKKHSLYFVGFQGSKLIHFDPHKCHPSINVRDNFNVETYVCQNPRKMSFSKMDPSCTFAFYLRTRKDLDDLIALSNSMDPKIFEILPGTKEEYLTFVEDTSRVRAFAHNECMFDETCDVVMDIGSLEGSDFEYLE